MTQTVHNIKLSLIALAMMCSLTSYSQTTSTELSFKNPVLKSGVDKAEGAIYRFSNVADGIDAEIKLKKFSRPDIYIENIDVSTLGFDKAFQPKFGIQGRVPANQSWSIDFQMNFYKAGTTTKKNITKFNFTALDIDGDNHTVREYNQFKNASSRQYSINTLLVDSSTVTPVFNNGGNTSQLFTCSADGINGQIKKCGTCGGTGLVSGLQCTICNGTGYTYKNCGHAFEMVNQARGPLTDFNSFGGIDTSATQVMVTYTYLDKNEINFTYGASTGATAGGNGYGVRLNSLWAKEFSLAAQGSRSLPVKFTGFSVLYSKGDAMVNWQTATEENVSHFLVQRSIDGVTYKTIATVFAGVYNYTYKDKNVSAPENMVYYRIVSVDENSATQLSAIRSIRLSKTQMQSLAITTFPNPVTNEVRVTLPDAWQGKAVTLQLYNVNSAIAKTIQLKSAGQTESMLMADIANGFYVIKASCGEETAQQRIIKN